MDKKAGEEGMPFVTHRLTPEMNNTFWVNLIGKGYPFPGTNYDGVRIG